MVQTLICAIKCVVYEHLEPLPEKLLYAHHLTYCKHMPSSSVKVKNEWSYTSSVPHVPTWHVKGQLYLYLFLQTNNKSVKCDKPCSIRFSLQCVKIKGHDISRHFKECISNIGLFHVKSFHHCDDYFFNSSIVLYQKGTQLFRYGPHFHTRVKGW